MTVETIENAFAELSVVERGEVMHWIEEFQERDFDQKIERDFALGGSGQSLLDELKREIAEGKTKPTEEACREQRYLRPIRSR